MLFNIVWSLGVTYRRNGRWIENEIAKGQAFGEPLVVVHLVGNMLADIQHMPPEDGYLTFVTTDSEGNHCQMMIHDNGKVTAEMFSVKGEEEYTDD